MNKTDNGYLRIAVKGFFKLLAMVSVIFVAAGRITYWQGWFFSGASFILFLILLVGFRNKTDLIKERVKPGPGMKWWDKVFYAFYIPMFIAIIIIATLDAGRFQWTAQLPVSVYVMSYLVFVITNFIVAWAMWTNKFFSSVVRIQEDRGQVVVQEGPYRFVRHPGYIGGMILMMSISLILGSLWGLLPAGLAVILLIVRTYLEDITLQKELPGYADYVKKVRYRLIPGIW